MNKFKSKLIFGLTAMLLAIGCASSATGGTLYEYQHTDDEDDLPQLIESIGKNGANGGQKRLQFDGYLVEIENRRLGLSKKLLEVIDSPNATAISKCCAAGYLAAIRTSIGSEILAKRIGEVSLDSPVWPEASFGLQPAGDALVQMGVGAIPALIRNLAEEDQPKVRNISLDVLIRIEMDRDVVEMRLQKAQRAETDSGRKSRMQEAIDSIKPDGVQKLINTLAQSETPWTRYYSFQLLCCISGDEEKARQELSRQIKRELDAERLSRLKRAANMHFYH